MPVLIVSQSGAITQRPSIADLMLHASVEIERKIIIITTDQTVTTNTTIICAQFIIANNSVITVNGGATLTITAEFQRPKGYSCFTGAGNVVIPSAGPGNLQDFVVKDLSAVNIAATAITASGIISGTIKESSGSSIAVNPTTDLTSTTNYVTITGAGPVTVTSFGTGSAGLSRRIRFASAGNTIQNTANIILPGGANVAVGAGDTLDLICTAANTWYCTQYTRGDQFPYNRFVKQLDTVGYSSLILPGGIIVNWGKATATNAGAVITIPAGYTYTDATSYQVAVTSIAYGSPVALTARTTGTFTLQASINTNCHWIAVGY